MSPSPDASAGGGSLRRRDLLAFAAAGAATAPRSLLGGPAARPASLRRARAAKQYDMKKSINLWAFPFPDGPESGDAAGMTLRQCFELAKDAGFDGVEINFDETGEFSAESTPEQIRAIRTMADEVGIAISGVCSFLFWPYSLTANDPATRARGRELAGKMIAAAKELHVENVLVVPGAVYIPWLEGAEPVPNDVCDARAKAAIQSLLPAAAAAGVSLNMENIFANGYLFSPQEMNAFVDSFDSPHVQVHFDTGNIMEYQFPEHWIPILGKRIKNIHFKEWDKRVHEFKLSTFRTLLDGTTNWPAVIEALDRIGYREYLTFEYFHPFQHYPEALIYQASDALDWMLGRKG